MRLLLDEATVPQLANVLTALGHPSQHVRDIGISGASDQEVELGAPPQVARREAHRGVRVRQRIEQLHDAVQDVAVVAHESLREARQIGGDDAVARGRCGRNARAHEHIPDDGTIRSPGEGDAIEPGETQFGGAGLGQSCPTSASALDQRTVDIEEEKAHVGSLRRGILTRGGQDVPDIHPSRGATPPKRRDSGSPRLSAGQRRTPRLLVGADPCDPHVTRRRLSSPPRMA